jgi:hypothetical protein
MGAIALVCRFIMGLNGKQTEVYQIINIYLITLKKGTKSLYMYHVSNMKFSDTKCDTRTGDPVVSTSQSGSPVSGDHKMVTYAHRDTCSLQL